MKTCTLGARVQAGNDNCHCATREAHLALPASAHVRAQARCMGALIPSDSVAMTLSLRSRLWLLVLSVWLPAMAGALWLATQADLAEPTVAGLSPAVLKVAVGSLLLLGLSALGVGWVARRITGPVHAPKHATQHAPKHAADDTQPGEPLAAGSVASTVGTSVGTSIAITVAITDCNEAAASPTPASGGFHRPRGALAPDTAAEAMRVDQAEQRISRSQHIEALGRLTGGVAHDFNNLLGVISNSAHLMQRHAGADLQAPLAATLRAVAVGSRLTQQLLRFAAQQPVQIQPVDLAHTLPALQALIQAVLGARTEVRIAVAPDTPRVNVDTNEFELALTNLTLNARDAMPLGGHLRLQARRAHDDEVPDLPDGEYVLITLSDDGRGIDDDAAWHAFEPFFTTKDVGQGSGLSLAQVMGFCVQAGGTARLTSTPGLGTTVSLLLPAHHEAAVRPAPATLLSPTHSIDGMRLLLVEDNDDLAEVTVELLSTVGCKVRRAIDSQVALRMIADEAAFDVVLSDVRMPGGMDGLGLARVLRDYCPDLPVVLLSGYAAQTLPDEDFVVLAKPCPPNELVAALHHAIEGVAAHR